jgi:hypothetical protein
MNKISKWSALTICIAWTLASIVLPPVMTGIPKDVLGLIDRLDNSERGTSITMDPRDVHALTGTLRRRQEMMMFNLHLVQFSGVITCLLAVIVFFGNRKVIQPAAGDYRLEDKANSQR